MKLLFLYSPMVSICVKFPGFLETDSYGLFSYCQNFMINTEYLRWALWEMYGEMRAGRPQKEGKNAVKYTAFQCQSCNSNCILLEEVAVL